MTKGLWQLVEERVAATPRAVMLVDDEDRSLSFGEFEARVERVAAALYARGVDVGVLVSWQEENRALRVQLGSKRLLCTDAQRRQRMGRRSQRKTRAPRTFSSTSIPHFE